MLRIIAKVTDIIYKTKKHSSTW